MPILTIESLCLAAKKFSELESSHFEISLFGVTDGKAVGTYLEHKFRNFLISEGYFFEQGNSASGIDFPGILVDMKVTNFKQPQSSCPFKSARQKIYGLGYSLIVFVYDKTDDRQRRTASLKIVDTIFIEAKLTGDFQMTKGLRDIVANQGNADDLMGFMLERNLPVDEIELNNLANEILINIPPEGQLTISNALQWRLQYSRAIENAGKVDGILAVYRGGPT